MTGPLPDPEADLTPSQRLCEIASVLAAGVLRLPRRVPAAASRPPGGVSESSQNPLDGANTSSPDPTVG